MRAEHGRIGSGVEVGDHPLVRIRGSRCVRAEDDIEDRRVRRQACSSGAGSPGRERSSDQTNVRRSRNRPNCSSSWRRQNLPMRPDPSTMNTCRVWGSTCRMSSTTRGKSLRTATRGFILAKRRAAQIALVDGREQERRVGEELLPILSGEDRGGAGDRHDEVRLPAIGEGRCDEVDDRLFRRAYEPFPAHDDLNEVHGLVGELVQFDTEIRREGVAHQDCRGRTIAAAEPVSGPIGPSRSLPRRGAARKRARLSPRRAGTRDPYRFQARGAVRDLPAFAPR